MDGGSRPSGAASVATVRTGTATWRRPAILLILLGLLVVAGAHPEAGSGLITDDHGFVVEHGHSTGEHEFPEGDHHEHSAHPTATPAVAHARDYVPEPADSAIILPEPTAQVCGAAIAAARQPGPPGRSGRQRLLDLSLSRT